LMTRRPPGGDEAVSRTISAVGFDDTYQIQYHHTNINLKLLKSKNSLPPISRPRRSVSDERIAPNQCTRIAMRRFYNGYVPAKKWVIVATIAGPQSRDFNRWAAGNQREETMDEIEDSSILSTEAEQQLKKAHTMKRPRSVTIISIFYWLNAFVLGAIGVITVLLLVGPYFNGVFPLSQISEEIPEILLWLSLPVGVIALAIFSAVVGWGLWQLRRWARRAAIVVSGLVIAINLVSFVVGLVNGQLPMPYGLVLHGLVLLGLTNVNVKYAFEPMGTE
jgi:hypothetical protein